MFMDLEEIKIQPLQLGKIFWLTLVDLEWSVTSSLRWFLGTKIYKKNLNSSRLGDHK